MMWMKNVCKQTQVTGVKVVEVTVGSDKSFVGVLNHP